MISPVDLRMYLHVRTREAVNIREESYLRQRGETASDAESGLVQGVRAANHNSFASGGIGNLPRERAYDS